MEEDDDRKKYLDDAKVQAPFNLEEERAKIREKLEKEHNERMARFEERRKKIEEEQQKRMALLEEEKQRKLREDAERRKQEEEERKRQ